MGDERAGSSERPDEGSQRFDPGGQQPAVGWQQPSYQQPSAPPATNLAAMAALVVGIASLLLFWIPLFGPLLGLVAIILAVVGMRAARDRAGGGKGMAVGGLITGIAGVILGVLFLVGLAWLINDDGFRQELERLDEIRETG
ncbi:MAG TPA: DUF4190 domain-containing protein [Egibacteraceae bacterium]|nr:DUF4190 domain-containing protein [Egibacteraceae bacterium]